jgi:RNA polymerase sigma factor (sigma-70 family)
MNDSRSDADLVTAYLDGAPDALAAIYDRYADSLHDTAAVMTRSPHDAADLTQDVFVRAAERLGQLRDRDRLKPWLFAVLRNEVYRRSRRQGRSRPVDFSAPADRREAVVDMAASADPAAEGGAVAYAQLAADLRDAAAGLDERDQLVLELTARHGLSGADLADALGVTIDQSYVVVHRMRERVERSLGALVVARTGRRSCAELADVLRGWDGGFSVLVRKRVARHVERCTVCAETRRRLAAVPLVALAPALAAPAGLRESVLDATRHVRPSRPRRGEYDDASGFPTAATSARSGSPWLAAAAATVVVLVGAIALLVTRSDPTGDAQRAPAGSGDTIAAMAGTTELGLAAPSPEPTSTEVRPATTTSLQSSPTVLPTAPPTAPPTPTTVPPSTTSPGPAVTGQFVIVTAADAQSPDVTITQGRPTVACPWSAPIVIAAAVTDVSTVDEVTLSWSGPGAPGSIAMTRSGSSWSGRLGIDQLGGTWTYVVTAVDAAGNSGTASGTTFVAGC